MSDLELKDETRHNSVNTRNLATQSPTSGRVGILDPSRAQLAPSHGQWDLLKNTSALTDSNHTKAGYGD